MIAVGDTTPLCRPNVSMGEIVTDRIDSGGAAAHPSGGRPTPCSTATAAVDAAASAATSRACFG